MKLYPFIAAEKAADRQVHMPCGLLGVSRSAYYQWSKQKPSARAREDQPLREQVVTIHRESRGTTERHACTSCYASRSALQQEACGEGRALRPAAAACPAHDDS